MEFANPVTAAVVARIAGHRRAVYRLLPSMSEARGKYRALTIGGELTRIIRWMLSGSPDDYPTKINAEWVGDPSWRPVEFSPGADEAPLLTGGIAEKFRADFEAAGRLQPLHVDGEDGFVFLVEQVVDCLDADKSSEPEWNGVIRESVFRADAVPTALPAFRGSAARVVGRSDAGTASRPVGFLTACFVETSPGLGG